MKLILVAAFLWLFTDAPLAAQPVTVFGGQVPCQVWLTTAGAQKEANAWVLALWSSMNVQASLDGKRSNIGPSMQPQDVVREVLSMCQRDPAKPMAFATAMARAEALSKER